MARELIDAGDARAAYTVVRDAALPTRDNYAVEREFMAGWIALRFLRDPATALTHFSRMTRGVENPISLARAGYWQGRAAEAIGRTSEARAHYNTAARYSTAYYGQLARARLGEHIVLHRPPPERQPARELSTGSKSCARIDMLYARASAISSPIMVADLGDKADDVAALAAIAEMAASPWRRARHGARRQACARARPVRWTCYAFPTAGCRNIATIGPPSRPGRRLCHRASGKRLQSERRSRAPRRWVTCR